MRAMTRRAAGLDGRPWDDDAREEVTRFFDDLAPAWHTRSTPERLAVVVDALERGLDPLLSPKGADAAAGPRTVVEVGSGLGAYSARIEERFDHVVAVEVAEEMHRRAAGPAHRVLADASRLPLAGHSVLAVVMINAFLFPREVGRVLRPGGVLLWVNSSGPDTPIHLSTQDVVAALPFEVSGAESQAGVATWCALQRVS